MRTPIQKAPSILFLGAGLGEMPGKPIFLQAGINIGPGKAGKAGEEPDVTSGMHEHLLQIASFRLLHHLFQGGKRLGGLGGCLPLDRGRPLFFDRLLG